MRCKDNIKSAINQDYCRLYIDNVTFFIFWKDFLWTEHHAARIVLWCKGTAVGECQVPLRLTNHRTERQLSSISSKQKLGFSLTPSLFSCLISLVTQSLTHIKHIPVAKSEGFQAKGNKNKFNRLKFTIMPNWCSTAYAIEGNATELKKLYELMKDLEKRQKPSVWSCTDSCLTHP